MDRVIRIWLEASEELYQLAAPPALLIVAITIPVVLLLMKRGSQPVSRNA